MTFGRRLLTTADAGEALALEKAKRRAEAFTEVDAVLARTVARWCAGEHVFSLSRDERYLSTVRIEGLDEKERALLDDRFSSLNLEQRGTWILGESATVSETNVDTPELYRQSYWPSEAIIAEWPRVLLKGSAEGVVFWSILAPLGRVLFTPLRLRGPRIGVAGEEEFAREWTELETTLDVLGLDVVTQLAPFRSGSGWSRLGPIVRLSACRDYLSALSSAITPDTLGRARLNRLRPAVERYYAKARPDGTALRKSTMTKALDTIVSLTFGGDWLAFLAYIGEEPHPQEKIIKAKAKPRVHAAGAARADELAKKLNLPAEEVRRIMELQWTGTGGESPLELRSAALASYWDAFDQAHARQRRGMPALWGLVSEGPHVFLTPESPDPQGRTIGLHDDVLPKDTLDTVNRFWGTTVLSRYPESLVTNIDPHGTLAAVLGPALDFWHGAGLTVWFLCEGPWSRTDFAGMEEYYGRLLGALEQANAPVNRSLFRDLISAENLRGLESPTERSDAGVDSFMSRTYFDGRTRSEFEQLRDIVTTYRREWAERHLASYVTSRWRADVEVASERYGHLAEELGQGPTLKKFVSAKVVEIATRWFGGNLADLYSAIGENAQFTPTYRRRMPSNVRLFAAQVRVCLRSLGADRRSEVRYPDGTLAREPLDYWETKIGGLVGLACRFIQTEEALGRLPTLKEFGASTFADKSDALAGSLEGAWEVFTEAVAIVRSELAS